MNQSIKPEESLIVFILQMCAMDEQCMVMCGEWVCGDGGKWDFVVDKQKMARVVSLSDGIALRELQGSVLREFGVEECVFTAWLSYWPPTTSELATGIRTPPVLLTSDGALSFFLQHLRAKGTMNLFVRFERKTTEDETVDDSGMGFVTPASLRTTTSSRPVFGSLRPGFMSSVGSGSMSSGRLSRETQKVPVVNLEDVEFVREVERAEEELNQGRSTRKGEALSGNSVGDDDGAPLEAEVDERDVRPRGYDKEFWSPLLGGDYGGSNAVNAVYNEDEILADLIKKTGRYSYNCTTNNAFDHVVEVGGPSNVKEDECVDKHPWMNSSNPWMSRGSRIPSVERATPVQSRNLGEVDDEEFDIPPLFDDTSYAAAEIPDMDLEDGDGRIYVGKVFGSKEDCQISLAIYAIRNQFRFK